MASFAPSITPKVVSEHVHIKFDLADCSYCLELSEAREFMKTFEVDKRVSLVFKEFVACRSVQIKRDDKESGTFTICHTQSMWAYKWPLTFAQFSAFLTFDSAISNEDWCEHMNSSKALRA